MFTAPEIDKKVMLVVTGEFGRSPRVEHNTGTATGVQQPGRDHWPNAMSVLVSGGGMRTGQIIGATNAKGEYSTERPLNPEDLWATVYRHLGIDWTQSFTDHSPAAAAQYILPDAKAIAELVELRTKRPPTMRTGFLSAGWKLWSLVICYLSLVSRSILSVTFHVFMFQSVSRHAVLLHLPPAPPFKLSHLDQREIEAEPGHSVFPVMPPWVWMASSGMRNRMQRNRDRRMRL